MPNPHATHRSARRAAKPLDHTRIEELALAYVARFATSAAKLEGYLARKTRERGWTEDEGEEGAASAIRDLVRRFVARGWVDDEGWGRMRASGLLARGYGARRVSEALREGGLGEDLRAALAPDERARREAVLNYARKRRFGPFAASTGQDAAERARLRQKHLAAMLRAGHDLAAAGRVLDAETVEEVAEWIADAETSPCRDVDDSA